MVHFKMNFDTSKFNKKIKKISFVSKKQAIKSIAKISFKIEGEAKYNIQTGSRSGVIYKRGSKTHQASAKGEFPKTDKGALVAGINAEFSNGGLIGEVGTRKSTPHGFLLEFGTSKMAPRPWLAPTIYNNKPFIYKTLNISLKKTLGKL